MISPKKQLIIERIFNLKAKDSARIKGASYVESKRPFSSDTLQQLSTYITILLVSPDRKTIWIA